MQNTGSTIKGSVRITALTLNAQTTQHLTVTLFQVTFTSHAFVRFPNSLDNKIPHKKIEDHNPSGWSVTSPVVRYRDS